MNGLEWGDAVFLNFESLERLNREFVAVLARFNAADDEQLPAAWSAVVDHAAQHFEQENQWMRKTRFAGAAQHMLQHRVVLNLLRHGLAMAQRGELTALRELAGELAAWFVKHTQALDAALAFHLRREACVRLIARRRANERRSGT